VIWRSGDRVIGKTKDFCRRFSQMNADQFIGRSENKSFTFGLQQNMQAVKTQG
jgi:hypothetical protein